MNVLLLFRAKLWTLFLKTASNFSQKVCQSFLQRNLSLLLSSGGFWITAYFIYVWKGELRLILVFVPSLSAPPFILAQSCPGPGNRAVSNFLLWIMWKCAGTVHVCCGVAVSWKQADIKAQVLPSLSLFNTWSTRVHLNLDCRSTSGKCFPTFRSLVSNMKNRAWDGFFSLLLKWRKNEQGYHMLSWECH